MTGPLEVGIGRLHATEAAPGENAPTILPGFGPFSHIEQYSTGKPGEFSHYGIKPNGEAVPLENFSGGAAVVGSPGQAAPASPEAPPVQTRPALLPQPPAPAPGMLPQGPPPGPAGASPAPPGPPPIPWSPPPMAPLRIAEPDQPPTYGGVGYQPPAGPPGPPAPQDGGPGTLPPQAQPGPGSAMAAQAAPGPLHVQGPDGKVVAFPAGTSNAKIDEVMRSLHQSGVPLEKTIDRKSGAPAGVRSAVGTAVTPEDRLATLRKFYPEAQPFEDDNFVFRDPKSGRPTLYNEDNQHIGPLSIPSMGDIASIGPEIAETVGGTVGGFGAAALAPVTGGGSLLAVPAASGGGALLGRELWQTIMGPAKGTVDTRSFGERAANDATTFGMNAVAPTVTKNLMSGAQRVLGSQVRYGREALGTPAARLLDFTKAGVRPIAPAVSGSWLTQGLSHGLHSLPGGSGPVAGAAEQSREQLGEAARRLARRYATGAGRNPGAAVPSTSEAGRAALQGATEAGRSFHDRVVNELGPALDRAVGPTERVPVTNVERVLNALRAERDAAPRTKGPRLSLAIERAQRVVDDANPAAPGMPTGIEFRSLREARTALGEELDHPDVTTWLPAQERAVRLVYGALREDIYAAAHEADRAAVAAGRPATAVRALATKDRYVRYHRNIVIPTLDAVRDSQGTLHNVDAVFRKVMQWTKEGGIEIKRLRMALPAERWDQIAGNILARLGRSKGSAQGVWKVDDEDAGFSVAYFMRNFADMSADARKAVFGGSRYADLVPQLERLERVAKMLKDADSLANTSRTAITLQMGGAALSVFQALMHFDFKAAAAVGATVGMSYLAAKALTSPRFVRWLADTSQARTVNAWHAQLGRLAGIAEIEPGIADFIHAYAKQLETAPPAGVPAAR